MTHLSPVPLQTRSSPGPQPEHSRHVILLHQEQCHGIEQRTQNTSHPQSWEKVLANPESLEESASMDLENFLFLLHFLGDCCIG